MRGGKWVGRKRIGSWAPKVPLKSDEDARDRNVCQAAGSVEAEKPEKLEPVAKTTASLTKQAPKCAKL